MTTDERVLYHQIHPAKLLTDLVAEVVSVVLLWRRHLRSGFVVHLGAPVLGSLIVLPRTDELERLKESKAGRYVRTEMTTLMVGLRVAGDVLTVAGALRHRPVLIALGALLVVAGWTLGPRPDDLSHRPSPPSGP
jgi:hypothetical protein